MSIDASNKPSVQVGFNVDAIKNLLGPLSNLTATGVIFWLVIVVHPAERKEWRLDRDQRLQEWTQTIKDNSDQLKDNTEFIKQAIEELRRHNALAQPQPSVEKETSSLINLEFPSLTMNR